MFDTLADTEGALSPHLLHHHVQSYESASAAHTSTAVDQQWRILGGWEQFTDVTDEPDDCHHIVRNSVVWPGSVVELSHCHWLGLLHKLCAYKCEILLTQTSFVTHMFHKEFSDVVLCIWCGG